MHQRQRGVGAVEHAEHVHVDHPPPFLGGGVLDRAEQHHAGVVHEHIQAPELVMSALDEGARLCLLTDVRGYRDGAAPFLGDALAERLDAIGPPCGECHGCPGTRAIQRDGLADPG